MSGINQKEYLKKYLGIGKGPGEKKKKKKSKKTSDGFKIVDDDVYISLDDEIREDLTADNEDAPQIVSVIDDRPPSLRIDEVTHNNLWKPLGAPEVSSFDKKLKFEGSIKLSSSKQGHSNLTQPRLITKSRQVTSSIQKYKKSDDFSPPRRKFNLDSDNSPIRTRKSEDISPQRLNKNSEDQSPPRKGQRRESDDISPSRRKRNDTDFSPPRKPIKEKREDISPSRKVQRSNDDNSPPRRRRGDIDSSPPRRIKRERSEDNSPPRKVQRRDSKDNSPPRKVRRHNEDNSPPRRKTDKDSSPPRRIKKERREDISPPRKPKERSEKKSRWTDLEDFEKLKKTLDGKKAGLQKAADLVQETRDLKKREDELFRNMSSEVSGANAATVVRGKKKEIDWEEEERRRKKEEESKEKYNQWGKGLKQVEDVNEKIKNELYEMSKPLARYADDQDLEKYLKDQEREGDPMLAYIRQKKKKKAVDEGKPVIQQYEGDAPPNRFGIRPGYRWDGVDRSNGYEKQWFQVQNARKANLEESFKWSTEDM